ncbi:AAA family protein [Colletotrichum truncatum]|uniref:AAA family protein n=1 Tax=Colletotrichum truncatum TaxID=5467 RepID=A0ACC3ZBK7_COLTU|nr:AAA family protein [Colletotrichum truncatum]KAF6787835.1 AAA family protein [Colletotrichum truncatum]
MRVPLSSRESSPLSTKRLSHASADEQTVESIFPTVGAEYNDDERLLSIEDGAKAEKASYGSKCSSKILYQHFDDDEDPFWSDEYPENVPLAAENDETKECAILVRKKKSADPRKSLEIDSIVIQSPFLKKSLEGALADYPDVNLNLERVEFNAPFGPFVHRWESFIATLTSKEHDEETRNHLKLLHKSIASEVTDTIRTIKDYKKSKVVDFERLWAIFEPGCNVLTTENSQQMAARFERADYIETRTGMQLMLDCDVINWSESSFGWEHKTFQIPAFKDTIPILALPVFPLKSHPRVSSISKTLVERGKLFEKLRGMQYRAYDGQAVQVVELQQSFEIREKVVRVQERVIVDATAYDRFNPHDSTLTHPIINDNMKDIESSRFGHAEYKVIPLDHLNKSNSDESLTDNQRLLCVPTVRGYALKTKRWLKLNISCVREITFNEEAFNSLVLPGSYKRLLGAFIESQLQFKNEFDDFVSGKGKGIVILLSGSPGTGKTLTVESVADVMKAPLYSLTAGDLGTGSEGVQRRLDDALQLAADWNAVLLIDECDVFLEARSNNNLVRNELVSIFLRTIEYYEGIMFLTTNRLNSIDPAFQSRVHLSLEYPGLEQLSRKEIWSGFLSRIAGGEQGHHLTDSEVEKLAALDLNGRQIKNVLKMANLLACSEKKMIEWEHVTSVLDVWRSKVD